MEEVVIQKDVFDKLVRYLVSRPFCEVDALIKQIDGGCRRIESGNTGEMESTINDEEEIG